MGAPDQHYCLLQSARTMLKLKTVASVPMIGKTTKIDQYGLTDSRVTQGQANVTVTEKRHVTGRKRNAQ